MNLKHFAIFIGLSLLLHLLLLLIAFSPWLVNWMTPLSFGNDAPDFSKEDMTLTVRSAPQKKRARYIDTAQSTPADQPPENAPFESDRDTRAASPVNSGGDPNRPTVDGRDIPSTDLHNERYSLSASTPAPPAPPPSAPPKPAQPVLKPDAHKGAALRPEAPPAQPQRQRPSPPAPPSTPGSTASRIAGRHLGGVAFQGAPSVDAQATEEGRYKAKLYNAISSRWYRKVEMDSGLLDISSVRFQFFVKADGTIADIQVIKGREHSALSAISMASILEVSGQLEPFSASLKEKLGNGFEDEVSFTIY